MVVIRRKKEGDEKKGSDPAIKSERNEMTADEIIWGAYYRTRHQQNEPQMQDFKDVFPPEEIAADVRRLESKESGYKEPIDERAATLEAFLSSDEVDEANWFGTKESPLHIQRVTRFDDSFAGVDSVWEWQRPDGGVVRLAFDATSASDETTLFQKLGHMQKSVQNKTMGKVKYFRSDLPSEKPGPMEQIPHVVIGTDAEGIQRLAKDYMPLVTATNELEKLEMQLKKHMPRDSDLAKKKELQTIIRGQKAKIAQDPLPSMILDQIDSQLGLQTVDTVAAFVRDYRRTAFTDPATEEVMTTLRSNLESVLTKYKAKEDYGTELKEFLDAAADALPAIGKIDGKRASQLAALHDTLTFIKSLVEEKNKSRRGAASDLPEARRKTNQVLSDRWSPYVNSQMPEASS